MQRRAAGEARDLPDSDPAPPAVAAVLAIILQPSHGRPAGWPVAFSIRHRSGAQPAVCRPTACRAQPAVVPVSRLVSVAPAVPTRVLPVHLWQLAYPAELFAPGIPVLPAQQLLRIALPKQPSLVVPAPQPGHEPAVGGLSAGQTHIYAAFPPGQRSDYLADAISAALPLPGRVPAGAPVSGQSIHAWT